MIAQATIEHLPLASDSVDLIFTDPPYPREYLPCYGWLASEAARVLKPGGFILAMAGNLFLNQVYRHFDNAGLEYFFNFFHATGNRQGMPVWVNKTGVGTRVSMPVKHFVCYSKGKSRPPVGSIAGFYETGPNSKDKRFHSWGQDVESANYYISCFSRPGDVVLDPFIGGGTTSVACELIGRRCVSFDLDPAALLTTRNRLASAEIPYQGTMFEIPVLDSPVPAPYTDDR